jgi:prevent-host-death family protein
MKSIDEAEARARLDELLDEAQRQPLAIRREGHEIAIVLSVAEYERLRVAAISEFLALRNNVASEASAAGLMDEQLTTLLNGDD